MLESYFLEYVVLIKIEIRLDDEIVYERKIDNFEFIHYRNILATPGLLRSTFFYNQQVVILNVQTVAMTA